MSREMNYWKVLAQGQGLRNNIIIKIIDSERNVKENVKLKILTSYGHLRAMTDGRIPKPQQNGNLKEEDDKKNLERWINCVTNDMTKYDFLPEKIEDRSG